MSYRKWIPLIIQVVGAVVGVAVAFVIFNWGVMPRLVGQGDQVEVPALSGLTLEDAALKLHESGLAVRDTLERTSSNMPAGLIMDQEPLSGRMVKPDRSVRLVISAGGRSRAVPTLTGQTLRFARMSLGSEGYLLGDVIRVPMDNVPPDFIMASDPPAGTVLGLGRPVHLLVSAAPAQQDYLLPDLRGRRIRQVREELESAGFVVRVQQSEHSLGGFGALRVENTFPRPGTRVRAGDRIVLVGG